MRHHMLPPLVPSLVKLCSYGMAFCMGVSVSLLALIIDLFAPPLIFFHSTLPIQGADQLIESRALPSQRYYQLCLLLFALWV